MDITTVENTEDSGRTLQSELAREARVSAAGETVAGLAHELSQPLSSIINFLEASLISLRRESMAPRIVIDLRAGIDEAKRAGNIIRGLRDFTMRRVSTRSPVALTALIRCVVFILQPEAVLAGAVLDVDVDEGMQPLLCDRLQVAEVMVHLLRNAIDSVAATDARPRRVTLRARPENDWVVITVMDSGAGLTPQAEASLFTPFFTTKTRGLGLGLATCKALLTLHGGAISHRPGPEGGATFEVRLPRVPEPDSK